MSRLAAALIVMALPIAALSQDAQGPADADRAEARAKVRAACAADVQRFCANIERGKGALRACLEANQKDLSPACSTARAERAAVRAKEKS
jgi:hypothetical protein